MNSKQKTSIGFLISLLIFAVLVALAYTVGFKFIEINFFQPTVIKGINLQLEDISKSFSEYYDLLNGRFSDFMADDVSKSFVEREPSEEILVERENKLGLLREEILGVEGIRFIEDDGIHIHFSTFKSDILSENDTLISYRNYSEYEIPYKKIDVGIAKDLPKTAEEFFESVKLFFDEDENQILFCYPFYDRMDAYRGTFVFYVSADDFVRTLAASEIVNLNTKISVVEPNGLVFGLPNLGREFLKHQISDKWEKRLFSVEQISSGHGEDSVNLFLISTEKNPRVLIGWVCEGSVFELSNGEKVLLLICLLFTVFLTILLVLNLRHDDMVIIKNRIKKFQYALLKEYVDRKDGADWQMLAKEISERKFDVFDELKNSLGKRGKKYNKEVDELLDSAWLETLAALGGKVTVTTPESKPENSQKGAEPVEELEEAADAESVEELEEATDAEPVEELEDATDAEPVEELEEATDAEPVEELEDATDAEPVEELEEATDAEPVEELEEATDAEPVEQLEEVTDADGTNDQEQDKIEYVEQSLEEFQRNDIPQRERSQEEENIKRQSEENFNVESLDFSELDDE